MSARLLRPQLFDTLSVVAVLLAAALSAWRGAAVTPAPFSLPVNPAASGLTHADSGGVVDASHNAQTGRGANLDSAAVVSANVFSASRHAPRVHYLSPDAPVNAPALPAPMRPMSADSTGRDSSAVADDAVPHLYGIVSQGDVRRALLRLSERDHDPQLFAEGDIHDGWQVMRIDTDVVTLRATGRGSTALRTLRLAPRSTGDPRRTRSTRDTSGTTP
jgi:hypothetical protein